MNHKEEFLKVLKKDCPTLFFKAFSMRGMTAIDTWAMEHVCTVFNFIEDYDRLRKLIKADKNVDKQRAINNFYKRLSKQIKNHPEYYGYYTL